MSNQKITMAEWEAMLAEMYRASPEGLSVREIAQRTGRSTSWTKDYIRGEIAAGRMRFAGRRRITAIDGRRSATPVYAPASGRKHPEIILDELRQRDAEDDRDIQAHTEEVT